MREQDSNVQFFLFMIVVYSILMSILLSGCSIQDKKYQEEKELYRKITVFEPITDLSSDYLEMAKEQVIIARACRLFEEYDRETTHLILAKQLYENAVTNNVVQDYEEPKE